MWQPVLALVLLATATAAAKPAPCNAEAIAKALRLRWKSPAVTVWKNPNPDPVTEVPGDGSSVRLDGPNNAWLELSCVAGSFGKPAVFVDALDNRQVGANRIIVRHRLIVTPDGKTVLASAPDAQPGRWDDYSYSSRVLDLDGDGVHEILIDTTFEHHALASSHSVTVLAMRSGSLAEIGQITIETSGTQWPTCTGSLVEEAASKAIHLVLVVPKTEPNCPPAGRHVYAIVAAKLVEIDVRGKPVKPSP